MAGSHLAGCCTTRTGRPIRQRGFQQALAACGIHCSMSRKANCWDNAVAERFFSSLKMELVHDAGCATREQG